MNIREFVKGLDVYKDIIDSHNLYENLDPNKYYLTNNIGMDEDDVEVLSKYPEAVAAIVVDSPGVERETVLFLDGDFGVCLS